jgi:uncharacterized SAM-binding protein YcdF (DUF218 family)
VEQVKSSPGRANLAKALGLIAGAALFTGGFAIVRAVPTVLVIDEPLEPADLIYVLNGKVDVRAGHAAAVFNRALAPRVVLPLDVAEHLASEVPGWRSTTTLIVHGLRERGVPRECIELIAFGDGVEDTRDEARALRAFLINQPVRRIIVVTTDYHTRRAKLVLEQELAQLPVEIQMSAATDSAVTPANWWRSRRGVRAYFGEMAKLLVVSLGADRE